MPSNKKMQVIQQHCEKSTEENRFLKIHLSCKLKPKPIYQLEYFQKNLFSYLAAALADTLLLHVGWKKTSESIIHMCFLVTTPL